MKELMFEVKAFHEALNETNTLKFYTDGTYKAGTYDKDDKNYSYWMIDGNGELLFKHRSNTDWHLWKHGNNGKDGPMSERILDLISLYYLEKDMLNAETDTNTTHE